MRIDEVWTLLEQEAGEQGLTALAIANRLGYARSNVSNDLNQLVKEGRARKMRGKPVLYFPAVANEKHDVDDASLATFLTSNRSLRKAFSQARAAILYPPNGMNMLILGEAGVGKSMFVEMLHCWGKKMGILAASAPFIVFNCADYSNNPQLLLSHIFGCRKGAYTGSVEDKPGLVEQAQNGILFLDEVHRLPPEGQEMFFIFMDKGLYRRLGEAEATRTASVRIFAATTEDTQSQLLSTFLRRFAMSIMLPPLRERDPHERFQLIQTFFNIESATLKQHVTVSGNVLRALLTYQCKNNVGQLKSDIRFACAMAYAANQSSSPGALRVGIQHLPWYVKEDFISDTHHREMWSTLPAVNHKALEFTGHEQSIIVPAGNNDTLYERMDSRASELKMRGLGDQDIEKALERDVLAYFRQVLTNYHPAALHNVVDLQTLTLTGQVISLSTQKLPYPLSHKVYYGLATHLENAISRIKENRIIRHPQLNKIRTQYPQEFNVALDVLQLIEKMTDVRLPIDEAGFLAQFFAWEQQYGNNAKRQVKIIVAAHGAQVASAMTATAHALLAVEYANAFDVPLEKKTCEVMEDIITLLEGESAHSEVLFLVDMGSLKMFADEVRERLGMRTRTFTYVSTMHIIDAIQGALAGKELDTIYQDLLVIDSEKQQDNRRNACAQCPPVQRDEMKKLVIIVCSSAGEKAVVLHHKIESLLKDQQGQIAIKTCNLQQPDAIQEYLLGIGEQWHIAALISLLPVATEIPQFACDELFTASGITRFIHCIASQRNYFLLEDALNSVIHHVDRQRLLSEIKKFNAQVQALYDIHYTFNILIGVTMHVACLIDRIADVTCQPEGDNLALPEDRLFITLQKHLARLQQVFNVVIPQRDILALHELLLRIKNSVPLVSGATLSDAPA
ncbi:transcription antiterminator BglG [Superficieibacter electus]|uniref:Transcription antiterminator BglG n=1 Tax=Superficieibacter electus TaxID=2022662 RepID=A0A2P5GPA1_9ENTR|nr:sigma 54-interacting transcriptional regulator [Superficieibacter electus]POP45015.1 transcription antiterminator BglG [Superficieibacter electus]POP48402.1 transcription antiterminator BglG [Superficieibacter electus]